MVKLNFVRLLLIFEGSLSTGCFACHVDEQLSFVNRHISEIFQHCDFFETFRYEFFLVVTEAFLKQTKHFAINKSRLFENTRSQEFSFISTTSISRSNDGLWNSKQKNGSTMNEFPITVFLKKSKLR